MEIQTTFDEFVNDVENLLVDTARKMHRAAGEQMDADQNSDGGIGLGDAMDAVARKWDQHVESFRELVQKQNA
jgi:hypothetical protein